MSEMRNERLRATVNAERGGCISRPEALCAEGPGARVGELQVFAPEGEAYPRVEPATGAPGTRRLAEACVGADGLVTLPPGHAPEGAVSLSFEAHG